MKSIARIDHESRLSQLVQDIQADLDRPWTSGELAERAGFSPFHFSRVCAGLIGETPIDLVRRLRLERAALELLSSNRTVSEIAIDAGYSLEAFSRLFREKFHRSPVEFRAKGGNPFLPCPSDVHVGRKVEIIFRGDAAMQLETQTIEPKTLVVRHHVGPYDTIGGAFQALMPHAFSLPTLPGPIAIYFDDPSQVPSDQLRSAAGVELSAVPENLTDGLDLLEVPGGKYVVGKYVGPYSGLGDAWNRFMGQDMPDNNFIAAEGLCFERYLNMPGEVPESELVTEIWVPLKD